MAHDQITDAAAAAERRRAESRSLVLCLDFGTACSKAAVARRESPADTVRPLRLTDPASFDPYASPLLRPSALFVDDGRVLFSDSALRRLEAKPDREALTSFKSLLSARDLAVLLDTAPRPRLEPTRLLSHRDLLVLAFANLLAAAQRGLADDVDRLTPQDCALRVTHPAWGAPENAAILAQLMRAGAHVLEQLGGAALLAPEGLAAEDAKAASVAARKRGEAGSPWAIEGALLEATAAALAHRGATPAAEFAVIMDMGAGTTDFAGLEFTDKPAVAPGSVHSSTEAGDSLDEFVLALIGRTLRRQSSEREAAIWRDARRQIRRHKETIFSQKRAALRLGERVVTFTERSVWGLGESKGFLAALKACLEASVAATASRAREAGAKRLTFIASGGGARLTFVHEMLKRAKARGLKTELAPLAPSWASAPRFAGELGVAFPQLAVALGGAVAPAYAVERLSSS